jgi:putative ABC transport system permease protein
MIRNFFKSTIRNILKARSFSILNILGLAIGITCAGLILVYV